MLRKIIKFISRDVIHLNLKEQYDNHYFNGKYLIVLNDDKNIIYRESF